MNKRVDKVVEMLLVVQVVHNYECKKDLDIVEKEVCD